ncbi:hypothetical protein B0J17DRAFT_245788 [Rhizoctonia solani]|nr:hypothetical protein B0J17DRAFT_245788 [Rhizoctonia solani]
MSIPVLRRSTKGCLTCKQRRKKCDEKRPQCDRCLRGDFHCLGYSHLAEGYPSPSTSNHERIDNEASPLDTSLLLDLQVNNAQSSIGVDYLPAGPYRPPIDYVEDQLQPNTPSFTYLQKLSLNIPRSPQLTPYERDNMVDLIVSQYLRLADRIPFRPLPYSFAKAVVARAHSSNLILRTMYLGARIIQALLDNNNWHNYVGWIDDYHHQISGTEPTITEVDVTHLADRLSAHSDSGGLLVASQMRPTLPSARGEIPTSVDSGVDHLDLPCTQSHETRNGQIYSLGYHFSYGPRYRPSS